MLDLEWCVHEVDGATLVGVVVESSAPTPRRVRIEPTLDGPVWPPRRDGVPARGWDGDRFEGVVPTDGQLPFGFASPAEPTEPPVFVVEHERAAPERDGDAASAGLTDGGTIDGDAASSVEVSVPRLTPDGVLRALGSSTPPRDAVPRPDDLVGDGSTEPSGGEPPPDVEVEDDQTTPAEPVTEPVDGEPPAIVSDPLNDEEDVEQLTGPAVPEAVVEWLSAVERRVERAEALADARRVTDAARALDRVDGIHGAERLVAALERDQRALEAVARRTRQLADRRADTDVPLSTLRAL